MQDLQEYLEKRAHFPRGAQMCTAPVSQLRVIFYKRINVFFEARPDGINIIRVLWNSEEITAEKFDE